MAASVSYAPAALLMMWMWLMTKATPKRTRPHSTLLDYHIMHLRVSGLDACVARIRTELAYMLRHPACKLGYWRRRDETWVHSAHFGWTEHQVAGHIVSYLPRVDMQHRLERIDQSEWKVGLYLMACPDGYVDGSNLLIYFDPSMVDDVGLIRLLGRIFDHTGCRFLHRRFRSRLLRVPVLAEAQSVARWFARLLHVGGCNRIEPHVPRSANISGTASASTHCVEILQADAGVSMYTAIVYHVVWSYYQSIECSERDRRALDRRGLRVCVHYTHDWEDLLDTMTVSRHGQIRLHFRPFELDMPLRAFVRKAPRELLPVQIRHRMRAPHSSDAHSADADLNISVWPICKNALASRDEAFKVASTRVTLKASDSSDLVVTVVNGELHYSYSLRPAIPVQQHRLCNLLAFRSHP
jgi:hypothetical protein